MTLRERVENNAAVFFLATLVIGFLAGLGTYEAILRMADLAPTSRAEIARMRRDGVELAEANRRLEAAEQARAAILKQLEEARRDLTDLRQHPSSQPEQSRATSALPGQTPAATTAALPDVGRNPTVSAPLDSRKEMTREQDGLLFEVRECGRSRQEVRCTFKITNQQDNPMPYFGLISRSSYEQLSYLVDNFGDQHPVKRLTLGSKAIGSDSESIRQGLEPQVPLNATVTAADIPVNATSVNLVVGYFTGTSLLSGRRTVSMRNLPVVESR